MPRIISAALNRDVLRVWAALVLVLWLVLLSARFSVYLGEAVVGRLAGGLVLKLTLLKSVGFAVFVMPLALYLALILVLEQRRRNFESVALAASGFGPFDYLRTLLASVLMIALLNALLVLFVVPATVDAGYRLRSETAAARDAQLWIPGRFFSLADGALLVYAEAAGAAGSLDGVFARLRQPDGTAWISAAGATLAIDAQGRRVLRFERGHRYQGAPGRADFKRLDFDRYSIDLPVRAEEKAFRWDAVATRDLYRSSEPGAEAQWQTRLSRPLSVLVLSFCALSLIGRSPGAGRLSLLAFGLTIFTVYFLLLGLADDFVAAGSLGPWPGLWWVHAVPLLIAAGLLFVRRRRWRA